MLLSYYFALIKLIPLAHIIWYLYVFRISKTSEFQQNRMDLIQLVAVNQYRFTDVHVQYMYDWKNIKSKQVYRCTRTVSISKDAYDVLVILSTSERQLYYIVVLLSLKADVTQMYFSMSLKGGVTQMSVLECCNGLPCGFDERKSDNLSEKSCTLWASHRHMSSLVLH